MVRAALLVLTAASLAACGNFGARAKVSVSSVPSGKDFYLVPKADWDVNGGEDMLDARQLGPYRKGVTDVEEAAARDFTYEVVVRCSSDHYEHITAAVRRDEPNTVRIYCNRDP